MRYTAFEEALAVIEPLLTVKPVPTTWISVPPAMLPLVGDTEMMVGDGREEMLAI